MLKLEHVSKSFGGLMAVNDVTAEITRPGVTGLVGPNGSGKTTLFHLITGFYSLDRGRILFDGRSIDGLPPYEISRRGLVRTFQQTRVIPSLSVLDNLLCAPPGQSGERISAIFFRPGRVRREERENRVRAEEILDLLKLSTVSDRPAGMISFGQQKLVEIGRVLMTRPHMIVLDEPTAGINPSLIRQIVDILEKLTRSGIRIFLIEHNMPLVMGICEEVFVMDSGSLIFQGPPDAAVKDRRVVEAYLGREQDAA